MHPYAFCLFQDVSSLYRQNTLAKQQFDGKAPHNLKKTTWSPVWQNQKFHHRSGVHEIIPNIIKVVTEYFPPESPESPEFPRAVAAQPPIHPARWRRGRTRLGQAAPVEPSLLFHQPCCSLDMLSIALFYVPG